MKFLKLFLIFVTFLCQINFGEFQVTFPENTVATTTTKAATTASLTPTVPSTSKQSSAANYTTTQNGTSLSSTLGSNSTTKASSVNGSSTLASNSSIAATTSKAANSTTNSTTTTKPISDSTSINANSTTKQANITTTMKTNVSSSTTPTTTKSVTSSGTKHVSTTISRTTVKSSINRTTTTTDPENTASTEEEPITEEESTTEELPTTEEESISEELSSTEYESTTESGNEESPEVSSTKATSTSSPLKTSNGPTKPTPVTGSSTTSFSSTPSRGTTMTRSECVTCRNATSTNSTTPASMTGTPGPTQQPGMSSSTTNSSTTGSTRNPRPTSKPHHNKTGICVTTGYCEIAGGHSSTDGSGNIDVRGTPVDNKSMTTKRRVGIENKGPDPITSGTSSKMTCPALTGVGQVNATQTQCAKGLELCCTPRHAIECGLRYPPVVGAPAMTRPRANYGAYPWQGIVFKDGAYWASGALIDNVNFITVAHRFFNQAPNLTEFKVRLGDWDLRSDKEPLAYQEYQVHSITIHPKYNPDTQTNDIAIITFTKNVTLGQVPTIGTGCLPAKPISGIRCWLSGWAMNTKNGTKYGPQFEVDLPIIDGPTCETLLRKTVLGPKFVFDQKSFLCAGGEPGKDATDGDNGSPLVCEVNRQFYITGLVAWGVDYGKKGVPGVYVNVNSFIPWIQSMTKPSCRNDTARH